MLNCDVAYCWLLLLFYIKGSTAAFILFATRQTAQTFTVKDDSWGKVSPAESFIIDPCVRDEDHGGGWHHRDVWVQSVTSSVASRLWHVKLWSLKLKAAPLWVLGSAQICQLCYWSIIGKINDQFINLSDQKNVAFTKQPLHQSFISTATCSTFSDSITYTLRNKGAI